MSQCERLKVWLERHGEIDPLTAWAELGIYRFGARIHDLRRHGMNIATLRKKVRNRFDELCEVALYRLEKATETHTEAPDGDIHGKVIPMVRPDKKESQEALNAAV